MILIQITSKRLRDAYSIEIRDIDFKEGNLKQLSNVRPNRVFTADKKIILYKVGHLNESKRNDITNAIVNILNDECL